MAIYVTARNGQKVIMLVGTQKNSASHKQKIFFWSLMSQITIRHVRTWVLMRCQVSNSSDYAKSPENVSNNINNTWPVCSVYAIFMPILDTFEGWFVTLFWNFLVFSSFSTLDFITDEYRMDTAYSIGKVWLVLPLKFERMSSLSRKKMRKSHKNSSIDWFLFWFREPQ